MYRHHFFNHLSFNFLDSCLWGQWLIGLTFSLSLVSATHFSEILHYPFFVLYLMLTSFFIRAGSFSFYFYHPTSFTPLLFFSQFALLMGEFLVHPTEAFQLLAILPFGAIFLSSEFARQKTLKLSLQKFTTLFFVGLFSLGYFLISLSKKTSEFSFLWVYGEISCVALVFLALKYRDLHVLKTSAERFHSEFDSSYGGELSSEEENDQYFFHDVINSTHGIILYLSSLSYKNKTLGPEEIEKMASEIQTLQWQLQNYFGDHHKNIGDIKRKTPFMWSDGILLIKEQKKIFLGSGQNFYLRVNEETRLSSKTEPLAISYLDFQRIVVNIFKNCREAKAEKIEVILSIEENWVHLQVINDAKSFNRFEYDLGQSLGKVICADKKSSEVGRGLKSIHWLIEKIGGEFNFYIKDNLWHSEVKWPKAQFLKTEFKSRDNLAS